MGQPTAGLYFSAARAYQNPKNRDCVETTAFIRIECIICNLNYLDLTLPCGKEPRGKGTLRPPSIDPRVSPREQQRSAQPGTRERLMAGVTEEGVVPKTL